MHSRYISKIVSALCFVCSLLTGIGLLAMPWSAQATVATIYVNAAAGGANNGTNWTDAYNDLQTALTAATSGTQIWVAAGTYKPGPAGDRTVTFAMKDGVAIYGGFPATGTPGWADRDWTTNVTTLSGDIDNNDLLDDDNAYNVVRANGIYGTVSSSAVLDGFTITGGNADATSGSFTYMGGGGLNNYYANPTLSNLLFTGNKATYGGAMYTDSGSPTLYNTTFTSNTATYGGALYIWANGGQPLLTKGTFSANTASDSGGALYNGGSPILTDISFTNNTANGNYYDGKGGGGVFNALGNPTLTRASFSGNIGYSGGGWFNQDGSPVLNDVTFANNTANGQDGDGGGMYIRYNASGIGPSLSNSTFSGNHAASSGGGLVNGYKATLTGVKFLNNSASGGYGGGVNMAENSISLIITNCLFAGNSIGSPLVNGLGGGLMAMAGSITITNSLFTGNSATLAYGGLYGGSATVHNSIIWGNTAGSNPNINSGVTVTNSDVQGSYPGTGNIDSNPAFVNAAGGNYYLATGSLCIDAGDDTLVPAGITTDLGGNPRFVGTVDMGPYEYDTPVGPIVAANPSSQSVNVGDMASFTAAASGYPFPAVQWQVSGDSGTTWNNISGATYTTLAFQVKASDAGNKYHAVFTNTSGTATTSAATLTIASPPAITSANSTIFTAGTLGSFSVTTTGAPAPSLTETGTLPSSVTFTDNGDGTATLSGAPDGAAENSYPLTFTATNSAGSATQSFTLTIYKAPSITTQPSNQTVTEGQTASFSAAASGNPDPSVRWQVLPVGGSWTDIPGATSTSYSFTAALTDNGNQYRTVFTNSVSSATSNPATLTVNAATGITVTSPSKGDTWRVGATQFITWSYNGAVGSYVQIDLLQNGVLVRTIVHRAPIGTGGEGSTTWKPHSKMAGENFEIKITSKTNSSYTDTSADFTILSR